MARLPTQRATPGGLAVAFVAATAAGDEFTPDRNQGLYAKNSSAASVDITVPTVAQVDGVEIADLVIPVPAGGERLVRLPPTLVRAADGFGDIGYSAAAGVTVAIIVLP